MNGGSFSDASMKFSAQDIAASIVKLQISPGFTIASAYKHMFNTQILLLLLLSLLTIKLALESDIIFSVVIKSNKLYESTKNIFLRYGPH